MEVTHVDDMTTHVVMSANKSLAVSMIDSPEIMHLLSGALYQNPAYAMIREVLCNAHDAHIAAGIPEQVIKISIHNGRLIVRDFGNGIPHDRIAEIYGTYGLSTKKNSKGETGGFGLGSKSPWSFTDVFGVTSYNKGTKTLYRLVKSDPENEGKPGIYPIIQTPTSETGLEVSIPLTSGKVSTERLIGYINSVVALGDMPVELDGEKLKRLPLSTAKRGYTLMTALELRKYSSALSDINIRYGAVVYPVINHDEYKSEFDEITKFLRPTQYSYRPVLSVILQAEPDSLSVSPSRDNLTLENKTVRTVKALLRKFLNELRSLDLYNKELLGYYRKQPVLSEISEEYDNLLEGTVFAQNMLETSMMISDSRIKLLNRAVYEKKIKAFFQETRNKGLTKDMLYKVKEHAGRSTPNYRGIFARHIQYPLIKALKECPNNVSAEFCLTRLDNLQSHDVYKISSDLIPSTDLVLELGKRHLVITNSRSSVWPDLEKQYPEWKDRKEAITIISTRTKSREKLKELGDIFTRHGFNVFNLAYDTWVAPKPTEKKVTVKKHKTAKYATLLSCLNKSNTSLSTQTSTPKEYIEKPVAYIEANEQHFMRMLNSRFFVDSLKELRIESVCCATASQIKILEKEGVPHFWDYLHKVFDEWVEENKKALTAHFQNNNLRNIYGGRIYSYSHTQICYLLDSETLCEAFNLPKPLNDFQKRYLNTIMFILRHRTRPFVEKFPLITVLEKKLRMEAFPYSKKQKERLRHIEESPYFTVFNLSYLKKVKDQAVLSKCVRIVTNYVTEEKEHGN